MFERGSLAPYCVLDVAEIGSDSDMALSPTAETKVCVVRCSQAFAAATYAPSPFEICLKVLQRLTRDPPSHVAYTVACCSGCAWPRFDLFGLLSLTPGWTSAITGGP